MYKRILVPIDGSETATKALVAALQLAREGGGQVRIVHMVEGLTPLAIDQYGAAWSGDLIGMLKKAGEEFLSDALAIARAAGVPADTEIFDNFGERLAETVVDAAKRFDADLVVVGTHGRRGMGRLLLGSGAEQIVRLAPVPVLVVRSPEDKSSSPHKQ
jgi:nucleotide-binding universal stress UspA family protein